MSEIEKSQTFVVGTGLNEGGAIAVRTAYELWRRLERVELHVIFALDTSEKDIGELDEKMDKAMELLRQHVVAAVEGLDLAPEGHIQPIGHVRLGKAADVVCQMGIDAEADLIVVGAHRGKVLGRLLGSVSDEIARTARMPVMVARPKDFSGVRHTSSVQPPRPDQGDVHAPATTSRLSFHGASRSTHLPGMI